MSPGLVSSSKSSLSYLVSRPEGGNVAVIAVGGAPEALDARPGALTLQVRLLGLGQEGTSGTGGDV